MNSHKPDRIREGHAHLFQLGRSLSMVDLSDCTSHEDMLDRLSARAKTTRKGDWILAHGARPDGWNNPSWPTLSQLDHACDDLCVAAWCFGDARTQDTAVGRGGPLRFVSRRRDPN